MAIKDFLKGLGNAVMEQVQRFDAYESELQGYSDEELYKVCDSDWDSTKRIAARGILKKRFKSCSDKELYYIYKNDVNKVKRSIATDILNERAETRKRRS